MVLMNVSHLRPGPPPRLASENAGAGLTGAAAQKGLEQCGIIVNMNRLPYDTRSAGVTSGLRLGTPIVTRNGMGDAEMKTIAGLIDAVLRGAEPLGEMDCRVDDRLRDHVTAKVVELCRTFPMRWDSQDV
jgi:glycine hydroxymethyltransferase